MPGERGLENLGATCYLNSLLQVMMHTETVRDAVLAVNPETLPVDSPQALLLRNLVRLFAREWRETGPAIVPRELFASLNKYDPRLFELGFQQDIDEAYSSFRTALMETVAAVIPARAEAFDLFSFDVTRTLLCDSGQELPPRVEQESRMFMSFPRVVPAEGLSVRSMIGSFFSPEGVTQMSSCGGGDGAIVPGMLSMPRVLVITLRRNAFGPKITMPVRIDHELPGNIFPGGEAVSRYRLAGVVHHHGASVAHGHYTANVRVGDSWYHANDSSFIEIRPPTISSTANFLVYELAN
jgi:ubiquitin C-terminal hydrolase